MAQHDMVIANQTASAARTDINNALEALVTNNSGATEPTTTYANQWWYDTVNNKLKFRNEADTAWIEIGELNQTSNTFNGGVPSGAVMSFAMNTAPSGWLECDGSAVSRTTYSALYAQIGDTYGAGDGSTTFNLPDLRGEFVRGWDNGAGVDTGRTFASSQLDAFQNFTGTISGSQDFLSGTGAFSGNGSTSGSRPNNDNNTKQSVTLDPSTVARTANETRPRNIALLYCIKS